MEDVNDIPAGLRSADRADQEAALRSLLNLPPEEFVAVDRHALLGAIRQRPIDEVTERLAFEFEGLEVPVDPDVADRMRLEAEPALGDEPAVASMDALIELDELEAEDG